MKLTQDQIQELFKFTRVHQVEYYDLQTELVDHLANGIESQWKENSTLNFEKVKQTEFKKFGIHGFADVIKERKKVLSKKYRSILWSYFKEWWSLPKLIGTCASITIIYTILRILPQGDLKFLSISFAFLSLSGLIFFRTFQLKSHLEGLWKKWLLQEIIYETSSSILSLTFVLVLNLFIAAKIIILDNPIGEMILAIMIICMILLLYISGYIIPSKAEKFLKETYPEYK